jgi:ABC-type uncharacterized transport system permease subunit
MTPETWEKFAPIAATFSNAMGALIFLVGAFVKTRFRFAFIVNAVATLLFTASNIFWLIMSLQQRHVISPLSREAVIHLFPAQALCAYAAVPIGLIGIGMLVWQARQPDQSGRT